MSPPLRLAASANSEGMRIRWCGRASNPVGDVNRFPVGSTPATFRQFAATASRRGAGCDLHLLASARRFEATVENPNNG